MIIKKNNKKKQRKKRMKAAAARLPTSESQSRACLNIAAELMTTGETVLPLVSVCVCVCVVVQAFEWLRNTQ